MDEVGKSIREHYEKLRVERETPIFLLLDNAGGHGIKETVDAYVASLKEDHNVVLVHQRPRSPATNMLDLGVWMIFQSLVEKLHLNKRHEVKTLCNMVSKA